MPRTLDPVLEAAFDSLTGTPYFVVTITNSQTLAVTFSGPAIKYKLKPLELSVKVQTSAYINISHANDRLVLARGMVVSGTPYTVITSSLYILDSFWDGNFQTFNCHIIPNKYYTSNGFDSYQNVISAFCTNFGKTAVFKDPAAAWLAYKFLPAGRNITLNNAHKFFNLLRQKYFIFAADNGSNAILFYTAFDSNTTANNTADAAKWEIDGEDSQQRRFIWRDQNGTIHGSDPSFFEIAHFYNPVSVVADLIQLDDTSYLAAGTGSGAVTRFVKRSTDQGVTWTDNDPFPVLGNPSTLIKLCDLGSGVVLALGDEPSRIYRSTNYGITWVNIKELSTTGTFFNSSDITKGASADVFAAGQHNNIWVVFKSTDSGLTWDSGTTIDADCTIDSLFFVGSDIILAGLFDNSPSRTETWRSTDNGANWSLVASVRLSNFINLGAGEIIGSEMTTGATYRSTNSGASWTLLSASAVFKIVKITATNWIAFGGYTFYESLNAGAAWSILIINNSAYTAQDAVYIADKRFLVSWYEVANRSAQVYLFDAENIQEYPIHNLGYLESTASPPDRNTSPNEPQFDPFPIHLKHLTGDHITIDLLPTANVYEVRRAEVVEELNTDLTYIPWRIYIAPTNWLSTTEAGALPSTIEAAAPYTPLATIGFNNILDANINNLQALADAMDDHTHTGTSAEEIQDLIGAMVSSNTETGIAVTYDDPNAKLNFDAQTAGDARYQLLDSDLTTIAGLSPTNDDIIQRKSGAWLNRTLTQLWTDLKALTGFPIDGTWTPTITHGANIDATVAYAWNYIRIGNQVFFNGLLEIDTTAIGAFDIGISLPFASNFTSQADASGNGTQPGTDIPNVGSIREDQANDRLRFDGYAQVLTNLFWRFSGGYIIK